MKGAEAKKKLLEKGICGGFAGAHVESLRNGRENGGQRGNRTGIGGRGVHTRRPAIQRSALPVNIGNEVQVSCESPVAAPEQGPPDDAHAPRQPE